MFFLLGSRKPLGSSSRSGRKRVAGLGARWAVLGSAVLSPRAAAPICVPSVQPLGSLLQPERGWRVSWRPREATSCSRAEAKGIGAWSSPNTLWVCGTGLTGESMSALQGLGSFPSPGLVTACLHCV